ncbi:hypothetical protein FSP39_005512 [Pinctada imbricata]|uniref:Uncharacterized protein n=1 Tax=Pinctada imbricata TaxID=66713 RepID=A0AA88YL03_PINIB|nr:hypothetical protein FSP39_005512 [Pinctada imbricata]
MLQVPENIPDSAKDSINRIHNLRSILKHTDMIHDPRAFRMYGYRPKYQRAQTIHHVLFYLLYDYRGKIHADRGLGSRPQIPVIDSQDKTGNQSENESCKVDVPVQGEGESTKTECPEQSTSGDQGKIFQFGSDGCYNEKAATEGQSQSEGPNVGNNEGQGQNEGGGKIEGQTQLKGQTQNEGHSLNEGQGQNEGWDLNEGQGQNKGQGQNEIQTQKEGGGQNEDQGQNVSQSKLEGEVKNKDQSQNEDQGYMETSKTIDQIQSLCDEEGSNTNNQGTLDQQQATEQNITGEDKKNKEGGTDQETDSAPSKGSPEMMEESVSLKIAKLIEDMPEPPVYLNEYTWRRYLPPLPQHIGFPEGWVLVSDILLHLPVSIFCSLNMIAYRVSINHSVLEIIHDAYRIPGLRELLNDPIKSLYPVICLPKELTHYLLYARKYIYSFHENCINLCNMGLISFGPQLLKEKDKVFIYLRKMTSLLDTRKSPQGCCVTKLSSRAERLYYMFKTEDDLENYWTDLRQFAFNSNLGFRSKFKYIVRVLLPLASYTVNMEFSAQR